MKSYEVIRQAVEEPGVKSVAANLKVSAALVYKWCEAPGSDSDPDQSGAKNPLDRVRELYQTTRDIRLIRYLCNEADGFFIANPPPQITQSNDQTLYQQTRRLVRDFSALLDSINDSVEDDESVDLKEADRIRQSWEDLKSNIEHFVVRCEEGHFHIK
ncbi:MAG TPA: phage regulatory CII family protein [Tepidisphaeraceae bacterium]|jgi:hypothetical protein